MHKAKTRGERGQTWQVPFDILKEEERKPEAKTEANRAVYKDIMALKIDP